MKRIHKIAGVLSLGLGLLGATNGWAGPLVANGGKAATPDKYQVTVKKVELLRADGTYFTFFSGSTQIDLGNGSVAPGGTGGAIGAGVSIPPATYNGLRLTIGRDFTINGSATAVGPAAGATCSTGGAGNVALGGYTIQAVNRNGAASDRVLSVPPEADAAINGIPGLAVTAGGDIQVTAPIPSFTVVASDTTPPALGVQFDVASKLEFLNNGANCVAIVLPPTMTVTTASGSVTYSSPF